MKIEKHGGDGRKKFEKNEWEKEITALEGDDLEGRKSVWAPHAGRYGRATPLQDFKKKRE